MCLDITVVAVIGFINAPYTANENDSMATFLVGLTSAAQLQRTLSILLTFSDGTARGKL